ncbi:hypothetical protein CYMTET_12181 [Cymbomonas tetramitiformis]|uniref:Pesticidal crystal protein Cry22Aa Ig-like domain-containing protein n=1 Tax=Cymbomonas tetramitiformis TaxID=36881 RepID=A0AAE0GL43_9CHLO|nr:hypothetical protein CYMTET_12181 [Cymbomonas tetramitiformis]
MDDLSYADAYEEPAPPHDGLPPEITLRGDAYVEVRQKDDYIDAGADVYDAVDGYNVRVVAEGVDSVDTCCVTEPATPFLITYRAADSAGNQAAEVVRQVAVVPMCAPPSYMCDEDAAGVQECALCTETESENETAATLMCECLDLMSELSDMLTEQTLTEEFVPEIDSTPPVLTLLGDGVLGITQSGIQVMAHYLIQSEEWTDPGVAAHDDLDGDLSRSVTSFGLGAVDTAAETPADAPYVVTYQVQDAAGNAAVEVRRRVYVTNPCASEGERVCLMDLGNNVTCTVGQGSMCPSNDFDADPEDDTEEPQLPPSITLIGPPAVSVEQGDVYAACPTEGGAMDLMCDKGAHAVDARDGDLTAIVVACTTDGVDNRYVNRGVLGCGVDTTQPGEYAVELAVTNSLGLSSALQRFVTVTAACPVGETLCRDGLTCSTEGVCISGLDGGNGVEESAAEDAPPTVTLHVSEAVPSAYVSVKQHHPYEKCGGGMEQQADALCEPGANATDAEDGDLTAGVLVCPPASCLRTGCPGHEWRYKGLAACVNTSAAVGTMFQVDFVVFDSMIPAQMATATRTVTITAPCASGEELCSDLGCSSIPCAERDAMLGVPEADEVPPAIRLLQPSPSRVVYGEATTAAGLRLCTSAAAASEAAPHPCLATASDDQSGDVTASITAAQDTECAACTASTCPFERPSACFPGTYAYLLGATDGAGNRAIARFLVKVVEQASVRTAVNISAGTLDAAAAAAQADLLMQEGSQESTAFRQGIAALLNSGGGDAAGEEVLPSDVNITAVDVRGANGALVLPESSTGAAPGGELYLEVHLSITANVAEGSDATLSGRRLLGDDGGGDALHARTEDLAATLQSSAADGRMSASLEDAAAAGNTSLATEVAGAENATTARLSAQVDEEAATVSSMLEIVAGMTHEASQSHSDMASALEDLQVAGGDPNGWRERLASRWASAEDAEFAHIDDLLGSANDALAKQDRARFAYKLFREQSNDAAAALQASSDAVNDVNMTLAGVDTRKGECFASPAGDGDFRYAFVASQGASGGRRHLLAPKTSGAKKVSQSPIEVHKGGIVAGGGNDFLEYASQNLPSGVDPLAEELLLRSRARYVDQGKKSALVAGILLYVTRSPKHQSSLACTWRFESLGAPCYTGVALEPFGTDPVFMATSELFRPDLQDKMDHFYNTSYGSAMMNPQSNSSFAFMPRHLPGKPDSQPFFFDVRVGSLRAKELVTFLEDGNLVDGSAHAVGVTFVTWNPHVGCWGLMEYGWSKVFNNWEVTYEIYSTTLEHKAISLQFLYAIWILVSASFVLFEMWSLRPAAVRRYRGGIYWRNLLLAHVLDAAVLLSSVCSVMRGSLVYLFLRSVTFQAHMDVNYPIYNDLYAEANFFLSSRAPSDGSLATPLAQDRPAAWGLPEDNEGLVRYTEDVATVAHVTWLMRTLFRSHAIHIMLMLSQLLVYIAKQERLAVIWESMRKSLYEIVCVVPAYAAIMSSFAALHVLQFGGRTRAFVRISSAMSAMSRRALCNDFQSVYTSGWELSSNDLMVQHMISVSSFFLFNIIISNFIFALIGNSICETLKTKRDARTVFQDLLMFYRNRVNRKILRKWPPMESVVQTLSSGLGCMEEMVKEKWHRKNPSAIRRLREEHLFDVCRHHLDEACISHILAAAYVYEQHKSSRRDTVHRARDQSAAHKNRQQRDSQGWHSHVVEITEIKVAKEHLAVSKRWAVNELSKHADLHTRLLLAWIAEAMDETQLFRPDAAALQRQQQQQTPPLDARGRRRLMHKELTEQLADTERKLRVLSAYQAAYANRISRMLDERMPQALPAAMASRSLQASGAPCI